MRVIFLGTNGWFDTDTGNSICTLIETEKASIILDAGNGLYKLDRYRAGDDGREAYLLLSHFHLDHIVGLHTLNKFRFPQGLTVCGPTGSRDILNTFVNRPFTAPLADLPYNTTIYEMPEEKNKLGITVDAKPLLHADPTIGYRIEVDGKVISYCHRYGVLRERRRTFALRRSSHRRMRLSERPGIGGLAPPQPRDGGEDRPRGGSETSRPRAFRRPAILDAGRPAGIGGRGEGPLSKHLCGL